jgi:1-acyl-sn-glycerol-3-phosphate acyltransferase
LKKLHCAGRKLPRAFPESLAWAQQETIHRRFEETWPLMSIPLASSSPTRDVARLDAPRSGLKHRVAGVVLWIGGWTPEGGPPALPKFVIVAAPHTWWWDSLWMLAFAWWWGLRVRWLLKSSIAEGPLAWFFRGLGAVSVDRSSPQGLVDSLAREVRANAEMVLTISPEGTRARKEWWKSGFYHLAREAKVPICLSYLDYGRQKGGFGPCFEPSGDVKADMDIVRAFYRDVRARKPDQFTPPRLREEEEE